MEWHNVAQNSDDWLALRIGKATGSNFGKIMANFGKAFGDPAKRYALQLALERVTGQRAEFSFQSDDMERGHVQEPVARALYEDMHFIEVTNGGFFDWTTYGDSPDGLVGKHGVLEIKSVTAGVHYDTYKRGSFDPAYRWQLVGHLDCSEREWVDFASYCSDFPEAGQLIVYRQDRDDFKAELLQLAERRAEFLELVDRLTHNIPEVGCYGARS